jgi:hypothetical protein
MSKDSRIAARVLAGKLGGHFVVTGNEVKDATTEEVVVRIGSSLRGSEPTMVLTLNVFSRHQVTEVKWAVRAVKERLKESRTRIDGQEITHECNVICVAPLPKGAISA